MQAGGATVAGLTGNLDALAALARTSLGANVAARVMTSPRAVAWLARNSTGPSKRSVGSLQALRQIATQDGQPEIGEFADAIDGGRENKRSNRAQKGFGSARHWMPGA